MKNDLTDFDISKYLDDKEIIAQYLTQVIREGDMDELFLAIGKRNKSNIKRYRIRSREFI